MKMRASNNVFLLCQFLLVSLNIISASLDARNETSLCKDCRESQVCCYNDCHWGSNCLGRDCKHDEHCSDGEMCCTDVCVVKNGTSRLGCYCQHSGQCGIGEICCGWGCASSCDGSWSRSCLRDQHCYYDEICCNRICVKGRTSKLGCNCKNDENCSKGLLCCGFSCVNVSRCLGRLCVHDEDCSDDEICCFETCIHRSETHLGCSCFNDEQCSKGQHCCSNKCVDAPNCLRLQCDDDWQCSAGESCCSSTCVNATNCLGRYCKTDRDCFQLTFQPRRKEENCCGGVCIDSYLKVSSLGCYCGYHSECFTGVESCCANTCVNGSSCVGFICNYESPKCADGETCCSNNFMCVNGTDCLEQNCQDDADCGFFENCCEGKCSRICIGKDPQVNYDPSKKSCESDKDCTKKDYGYCCNGQCSNHSVCFTPLMTTITVIVSLGVLIFLIATCIKLCCRLKRRILRETLLLQSEDITTEQALDSQLFPLLPPYQPDDYAPPEYEQYQTDIDTSYYPQTIEGYEPPPPYSAEFQGESGGEHTKI